MGARPRAGQIGSEDGLRLDSGGGSRSGSVESDEVYVLHQTRDACFQEPRILLAAREVDPFEMYHGAIPRLEQQLHLTRRDAEGGTWSE